VARRTRAAQLVVLEHWQFRCQAIFKGGERSFFFNGDCRWLFRGASTFLTTSSSGIAKVLK